MNPSVSGASRQLLVIQRTTGTAASAVSIGSALALGISGNAAFAIPLVLALGYLVAVACGVPAVLRCQLRDYPGDRSESRVWRAQTIEQGRHDARRTLSSQSPLTAGWLTLDAAGWHWQPRSRTEAVAASWPASSQVRVTSVLPGWPTSFVTLQAAGEPIGEFWVLGAQSLSRAAPEPPSSPS